MFNIVTKLKTVKQNIRQWNKECFKSIFEERCKIEEALKVALEKVIQNGMDDNSYAEKELTRKLNYVLSKEEIFWRQKFKEMWLKARDKNTKYFRNSTKVCKEVDRISSIKLSDGKLLAKPEEIKAAAIVYFHKFGFQREWLDWVFGWVTCPIFSILVNGSPEGFFNASRGLQQGDPLSPFLFIIMAKSLGRSVNKAYSDGWLEGLQVTSSLLAITHQ